MLFELFGTYLDSLVQFWTQALTIRDPPFRHPAAHRVATRRKEPPEKAVAVVLRMFGALCMHLWSVLLRVGWGER